MSVSYITKLKFLKITLIVIIIMIILSFIVVPLLYLKIRDKSYFFAANILSGLLKKEINPPVISGTTQQGGAYYLSAQKITNNFLEYNIKEVHAIKVTQPNLIYTTNKNGLIFTITSNKAIINPIKHIINIPGTINIKSTQNYSGTLHNFIINIKEDSGESNGPLTGYFNNKLLKANGIKIKQGGNLVIFKGEVEIHTQ